MVILIFLTNFSSFSCTQFGFGMLFRRWQFFIYRPLGVSNLVKGPALLLALLLRMWPWSLILCYRTMKYFSMLSETLLVYCGSQIALIPQESVWTAMPSCVADDSHALCSLFYRVASDISVAWCEVNETAFSNRMDVTLMNPLLVMCSLYQHVMYVRFPYSSFKTLYISVGAWWQSAP